MWFAAQPSFIAELVLLNGAAYVRAGVSSFVVPRRYGSAAVAFCGPLSTSPAGFSLKLISSKPRDGTSSSPSLVKGEASLSLGLRKLTEMKPTPAPLLPSGDSFSLGTPVSTSPAVFLD